MILAYHNGVTLKVVILKDMRQSRLVKQLLIVLEDLESIPNPKSTFLLDGSSLGQACYPKIILCFVKTQQNPIITYITKERIVNIGDKVNLQCSVQYAENYPVMWVKLDPENSDQYVLSSGGNIIVSDPRFSVHHDKERNSYTLQILKIQEIDAGLYQCEIITGTNNKITASVLIHIRISPYIADNSTKSVIINVGNNVTLQCYAYGYPIPHIFWRRRNGILLPTGGVIYYGNILSIYNISKNDRGTYYCLAENGVRKGAHRPIGVEVMFAPEVQAKRSQYGQALQYDIDLLCQIEAFPSPAVLWIKDGIQLQNNQHYQISIFPTDDEFTETILRVKQIDKKQYGNYTCRAVNKLGQGEAIMQLYETPYAVCPPACKSNYLHNAESRIVIYNILILIMLVLMLF